MKAIFNDQINDRFWSNDITSADERLIDDIWYNDDTLFLNMQHSKVFAGISSWSELSLMHYHILIYATFDMLDSFNGKDIDEITFRFREPFTSLRYIAAALRKFFILDYVSGFDTIIISRDKQNKVYIKLEKEYVFSFEDNKPKNNVIQLVVDNTK